MSAALPYSDYLDLVPKVELHLHIAGAVRAGTLVEFATMNGSRLLAALPRQRFRNSRHDHDGGD